MRKLTVLLSVAFILLLGFAAWFYLGGTLRAAPYIQTARASDYPEAFASVRRLVYAGQSPQILGGEGIDESPDGYELVDIAVTLTNPGLFPAEWLHVSVVPAAGDIAVYALTGEGSDIAPRDSAQVNVKLITTARPDAERTLTIQYYVYGMKREITVR